MSNFIIENHSALRRRHYLLLANQVSHWFNASPNVIDKHRKQYGDDFCVVLWRNGADNDTYVIPFQKLTSLFSTKNLVAGSGGRLRWHGGVNSSQLSLR